MISTAPRTRDHAGRQRQDAAFEAAVAVPMPMAVTVAVPVSMAVLMPVAVAVSITVSVPMAVPVSGTAAGGRARRHAHRLVQHVRADADDDQEARGAHPRHLREPDSEACLQHGVRQPYDDDRRDDVDDRDLGGHHDAAHHSDLPAEEVRDDDELAVSGAERVDNSIGERDGEAEEERAEVVAPFDGVHVRRDLGVRTTLEIDDVPGERRERAGVLLDDLHTRRLGRGLGHRGRHREHDRQQSGDRRRDQRTRARDSPPARPIDRHGFILRTRASRDEGVRTARHGHARPETCNATPPRRRRE